MTVSSAGERFTASTMRALLPPSSGPVHVPLQRLDGTKPIGRQSGITSYRKKFLTCMRRHSLRLPHPNFPARVIRAAAQHTTPQLPSIPFTCRPSLCSPCHSYPPCVTTSLGNRWKLSTLPRRGGVPNLSIGASWGSWERFALVSDSAC